MTRDELIEAMARAIYSAEGFVHNSDDRMFEPVKWEEADADEYQCIRDGFRQKADAALTAIEAQGLAIVPVEATEAMENSAEDLGANGPLSVDCWEAMIRVGRL